MPFDHDLYYRTNEEYRRGYDGDNGEYKRLREQTEALLANAQARAAELNAQEADLRAMLAGLQPGLKLVPPPMPYEAPKKERGVYGINSPDAIGAGLLYAYDSKGRVIARLEVPAMLGANQTLVNALHDWLDEIDPAEDVDPAAEERDRVRALLSVDEGGNKPPRGRPRTKRRSFRVERGGQSRRYTPRLS